MAKDAVAYADWLRQCVSGKTAQGEFVWPQLLDTGGTPERALGVFVEKHLSQADGWLALTDDVAAQVGSWLSRLDVAWLALPALQGQADDVATKKALWQSLKQAT